MDDKPVSKEPEPEMTPVPTELLEQIHALVEARRYASQSIYIGVDERDDSSFL